MAALIRASHHLDIAMLMLLLRDWLLELARILAREAE